ncbi:MAG: hypothetical protein RLZZ337_276 [Bacteroidota bacterium]|jgi:hypothetical protein
MFKESIVNNVPLKARMKLTGYNFFGLVLGYLGLSLSKRGKYRSPNEQMNQLFYW